MEWKNWKPFGVWKGVKGMKHWCKNNCVRCNVACPARCVEGWTSMSSTTVKKTSVKKTSTRKTSTRRTSTRRTSTRRTSCTMEKHQWKPKSVWNRNDGMKSWCKLNCVRCNVACKENCEIV